MTRGPDSQNEGRGSSLLRHAESLAQRLAKSCSGSAAVLFIVGLFVSARWMSLPIDRRGGDLAQLIVGARLLNRGQTNHLYDHDPAYVHIANSPEVLAAAGDATSAGSINPLVYPPVFAWLARPLAQLPFREAWAVWGWAGCFAVAAFLAIAWRHYGKKSDPRPLLVLAVALPFLQPYKALLKLGNVMSFIAAALVVAAALQRRGRSVAAGLILSLPVALKLSPAVLAIPWLLRGDRMALRALVTGWVAWMAISAAIVGPDVLGEYFVNLSQFGSATVVAWNNHSLSAFWHRWEYPRADAWTWAIMLKRPRATIATAATIALGVLVVVRSAWRSRRPIREYTQALVLIEALALAAITLVPTFAWSHYYLLLAPGFFATSVDASRAEQGALLFALALLCDPLAPDQTSSLFWSANAIVPGHTFAGVIVSSLLIRRLRSAFEGPDPTVGG